MPCRSAKDSINLETYLFEQDPLGLKFADMLIAKQREGVQVSIIYDAVGTLGTPEAFFTRMQDAGIKLLPFHPVSPIHKPGRWRLNNRDHRKIIEAAHRGVDVKVILPAISDGALVAYASHSFYKQMLEAGIKVYQLKASVLHAKTAVIDGTWSTVGSTNLDTRSFLHNKEINVVVMGDGFGQEMESAFNEDLKDSNEIQLETWTHRSLWQRFMEWFSRRFSYWL